MAAIQSNGNGSLTMTTTATTATRTRPAADAPETPLGTAPAAAPTRPELLTAADLMRLHSEGIRGELIRGVLHQTVATGIEHGQTVANLTILVGAVVKPGRLGWLFCSDAGVRLERGPDTVREPDMAFISAERLPLDVRVRGYAEIAPDLVVEIVSPSDRPVAVHDKAQMWLRYGVRLVWVVNPETRTIITMPADGPDRTLYEDDTLDGGEVIPGFSCPVRDVFDL